MGTTITEMILGFIAAAVAVVAVHQSIIFVLNKAGVLPNKPWSMDPIGQFGIPTIVNSIFWGGLWGVVFAILHDVLPGNATWIKGLVFGLLIALISNFTLLPLIKGTPLFMGYDVKKIVGVLIVLSGFGMATAAIYDILRGTL